MSSRRSDQMRAAVAAATAATRHFVETPDTPWRPAIDAPAPIRAAVRGSIATNGFEGLENRCPHDSVAQGASWVWLGFQPGPPARWCYTCTLAEMQLLTDASTVLCISCWGPAGVVVSEHFVQNFGRFVVLFTICASCMGDRA